MVLIPFPLINCQISPVTLLVSSPHHLLLTLLVNADLGSYFAEEELCSLTSCVEFMVVRAVRLLASLSTSLVFRNVEI